jgi:hypothetical protein
MKNKPDLVALDDSEYPSWLWKILDDGKGGKGKADSAEGEIRKFFFILHFGRYYYSSFRTIL